MCDSYEISRRWESGSQAIAYFNLRFIFGCAVSLLLLRRLLSSFRDWRLLSSCSERASHCGGSSCSRVQALGLQELRLLGSVVGAPRFSCSWTLSLRG